MTVTSSVEPDDLSGKDVLVIGNLNLVRSQALFANAPIHFENGRPIVEERSFLQTVTALLDGSENDDPAKAASILDDAHGFTGIVSFRSPFAPHRTVVALLSDDGSTLPGLVDDMADVKFNATIQNDLAVSVGDSMNSFAIGHRYWVGTLPLWVRATYWVSQRPWILGLCMIFLAVVLTSPVYLFLQRYAQRRLGEQGDTA